MQQTDINRIMWTEVKVRLTAVNVQFPLLNLIEVRTIIRRMKQTQTQMAALWVMTPCSLIVSTNVSGGHSASIFTTK